MDKWKAETVFFDDYPQFCETGDVGAYRDLLNLRYEALFAANRDIFPGARVLDLASHDGRWSFAALRTGASHVTGIEARQTPIDNARENFSHYGEDPGSYRFVCGDVLDVLSREKFDVDVVLCLSYLYHTYRHAELLYRLHEMGVNHLIIDSLVVPNVQQPFVKVVLENYPDKPGNAILDEFSLDRALAGRPSVPALRKMLQAYDFEVEHTYDWPALLDQHPKVTRSDDYAQGKRVTMRCRAGVSMPSTAETTAAAGSGGSAATSPLEPSPAPNRAVRHSRGPAAGRSQQPSSGSRSRVLVNRALAAATGYELRRAPQPRRG